MKRSIEEWEGILKEIKKSQSVDGQLDEDEIRTLVLQSINFKLINYKSRMRKVEVIKMMKEKFPEEYAEVEAQFK